MKNRLRGATSIVVVSILALGLGVSTVALADDVLSLAIGKSLHSSPMKPRENGETWIMETCLQEEVFLGGDYDDCAERKCYALYEPGFGGNTGAYQDCLSGADYRG